MDFSRPSSSGLDDALRPSLDGPITKFEDDLPLDPPKNATSYDELRRLHREEWQKRNNTNPGLSRRPSETDKNPGSYSQGPPSKYPPAERLDHVEKNKYGDVWT